MVVSQTYLVAQITVEQISLNLADEINSLKLKNFKFRGNRSIFVRTERLNTIVRKFARIASHSTVPFENLETAANREKFPENPKTVEFPKCEPFKGKL